MLRIRLRRVGKKKQPQYRIVIADSRSPRDGAFIEQLGTYNPLVEPAAISFDEDRAVKWLKDGAQPSDTVLRMFKNSGIMERVKDDA